MGGFIGIEKLRRQRSARRGSGGQGCGIVIGQCQSGRSAGTAEKVPQLRSNLRYSEGHPSSLWKRGWLLRLSPRLLLNKPTFSTSTVHYSSLPIDLSRLDMSVQLRGGDLPALGGRSETTLTVLGCGMPNDCPSVHAFDFLPGTLGIAILSGIFSSLSESKSTAAYPDSGTATPAEGGPVRTPTKFIACVRRPESAKRINKALASYSFPVTVLQDDNVKGAQEADVVILGCKPQMVRDVIDVPGMREALKGKLLISILAGVTVPQIEETLYGSASSRAPQDDGRCRIVRVMPNTAAIVRESMTVIATSTPPLPPHLDSIVTWIFSRVGRVVHLPPSMMDVSTALCGSGPAFMALILEATADGAVAMGLPRAEAQLMAAQMMRGMTGMVLDGDHPALIREKVSTPGGCTIGGLLVLEDGRVRSSMAGSIREATVVASQLGQGAKNVNGTRR